MLDRALSDSWEFFKTHLWMLAAIILPVVVPLELLMTAYQDASVATGEELSFSEQAIYIAATFAFYPLYMTGVVFYIASVVADRRTSLTELWKLGLRYWAPFLAMLVLVWLSVTVGLMLLVVPGIILSVRFAFAEFDLLLNQSSPLEAMKNSWRMTRGHGWVLFGGYLVISLAIYIPYFIIEYIFSVVGLTHWTAMGILSALVSVASLFYTIFAFRVFDLSQSEPPLESEQPAEPEPEQTSE